MIDREGPLSVVQQCKLLGLSRARIYRLPTPISAAKLDLMNRIDRLHLDHPHMGSRSIRDQLIRQGIAISRGRVKTLMRKMGIAAVYRKPRTTIPNLAHKVYPYLLANRVITKPNQVWCADITYIPMAKGFAYLVAVMDWATRKVLSWRVSNTMSTDFCTDALEEAIARYGRPEIFNTDQGSQFTSEDFTDILINNDIDISMDGKGRWMDNVFIERLWRSVKYEHVYLHSYDSIGELRAGLKAYFTFFNEDRTHQALARQTPDEVYYANNRLRKAA
jgi:putative transposase